MDVGNDGDPHVLPQMFRAAIIPRAAHDGSHSTMLEIAPSSFPKEWLVAIILQPMTAHRNRIGDSGMKVDGHCHCGLITFEAEVDANALTICHCTDCRRLSGTAFRTTIPATAENFTLLSGSPKTYVKTADSGNKRVQAFCGNCGTPIYACSLENPQSYSIRAGTVTQLEALTPHKQIWRRSALNWVDTIADMPASEKD